MLYNSIFARKDMKRTERKKTLRDTMVMTVEGRGYHMEKQHNVWAINFEPREGERYGLHVVMDRKEARALRRFIKKGNGGLNDK